MSFDNLLLISLLASGIVLFSTWLLLHWRWLPIVLLLIVWFIPRQAVPNGIFENFLLLRWLTVILIPLIFVVQWFKNNMHRERFVIPLRIVVPLGIISLIYLVSGIVNNTKAIELVGSLILYLRYPLLFIAFINMDLNLTDVKKFLYAFFVLILLQIPECLYRFIFLGISGDFVSFTLGPWGAFDLGIYATFAICFVIAYNIITGFKLYHILLIFLFFILAIIGEIKAFIFTIPIVSLTIFLYGYRKNLTRNKLIPIFLVAIVIIIIVFISQRWGEVHKSSGNMLAYYFQIITDVLTNPSLLVSSAGVKPDAATRFLGSAFVFEYLKHSGQSILWGAGPGSLMAGSFTGIPGRLYELPKYLNQLAVIIGEIGILGLVGYLWLLINVFGIIKNTIILVEDSYTKFISLALIGMWFFYTILGPFYDLVWRHDSPNLIFWFLTAMLYRQQVAREKIVSYNP